MADMDFAWTAQVPPAGSKMNFDDKLLAKKFAVSDNYEYRDDYKEYTREVITDRNSDTPFLDADMAPENRGLAGQANINLRTIGLRGSVDLIQGQELYLGDMSEGREEYYAGDMVKRSIDQNKFRNRYKQFGLSGEEPLPVHELVPDQKIIRDLTRIRQTMGNRFERTEEKKGFIRSLPHAEAAATFNRNLVRELTVSSGVRDIKSKDSGKRAVKDKGVARRAGLESDVENWFKTHVIGRSENNHSGKAKSRDGARPEGEIAFAKSDEHKLRQLKSAIRTLMKHRYVIGSPNRDDQDYKDQLNTYVYHKKTIVALINSLQNTQMDQLLKESFVGGTRGRTNVKALGNLYDMTVTTLNSREQYKNRVVGVRAPKPVSGVDTDTDMSLLATIINPVVHTFKSGTIRNVVDHFMSYVSVGDVDQKNVVIGKHARVCAQAPVFNNLEYVRAQSKKSCLGKSARHVQPEHQLRNVVDGTEYGRDLTWATPTCNRKPVQHVSGAKNSMRMISEEGMGDI